MHTKVIAYLSKPEMENINKISRKLEISKTMVIRNALRLLFVAEKDLLYKKKTQILKVQVNNL